MKTLKSKAQMKILRQQSKPLFRFQLNPKISQRKASFNYPKTQTRQTMANQIKLVKSINQKNTKQVQLSKPVRMLKLIRRPQTPMPTTSLSSMSTSHLEEKVLPQKKLHQHQLPKFLFLMKLRMLNQLKSPRKRKVIKFHHQRNQRSQLRTKSKRRLQSKKSRP